MALTRRGFFQGAGKCAAGVALVAVGAKAVAALDAGDNTVALRVPALQPGCTTASGKMFQWRLVQDYRGREVVLREDWAVADMAGNEIFDRSLWPRVYIFEPKKRSRIISRFALFNPENDEEVCSMPVNQTIMIGDTLQIEVQEITIG